MCLLLHVLSKEETDSGFPLAWLVLWPGLPPDWRCLPLTAEQSDIINLDRLMFFFGLHVSGKSQKEAVYCYFPWGEFMHDSPGQWDYWKNVIQSKLQQYFQAYEIMLTTTTKKMRLGNCYPAYRFLPFLCHCHCVLSLMHFFSFWKSTNFD